MYSGTMGFTKLNRLLIVDDHALVRSGMRAVLEGCELVGEISEASSGEKAIDMVASQPFDVVFMDLNLPGLDGLNASLEIRKVLPDVRIIIVTGQVDKTVSRNLNGSGINGYISKDSNADEIENALRQVVQGRSHLSPDIAQLVAMDMINGDTENPFDKLTSREHEIIKLLFDGKRNLHIARALFISEKTVSTHRTRAFDKLGVSNTAELIRLAMRHGHWEN